MTDPISAISTPTAPTAPTPAIPAPGTTKEDIHATAQKFEAMLMRQVLAQARKTDFGNTLLTNEGTKTFREVQDSRYADTIAQQGKLGFAKLIEAQLTRQAHLTPSTTGKGG